MGWLDAVNTVARLPAVNTVPRLAAVITVVRLAAWLAIACVSPAGAHELHHDVMRDEAVVVALYYPGEIRFAFESYEIFAPREDVPFQVGRTDREGRIVFLPDRAGRWRIRAFSPDGHGKEITVDCDPSGALRGGGAGGGDALGDGAIDGDAIDGGGRKTASRYARIAAGIAVIFGVFAALYLLRRSR